jgi:hypothetical protein
MIDLDLYFPPPPTLKQKLDEWLKTADLSRPVELISDEIIEIVSSHLPKEEENPTFNTLQWNKCVRSMRKRLR